MERKASEYIFELCHHYTYLPCLAVLPSVVGVHVVLAIPFLIQTKKKIAVHLLNVALHVLIFVDSVSSNSNDIWHLYFKNKIQHLKSRYEEHSIYFLFTLMLIYQ